MVRVPAWILGGVLLALLAPATRPQERPERPGRPERPTFKYFTQLGDQVLNQVDAVLFGKVAGITSMPGTDVVRVTIATWYLGERKEGQEEVTLLASRGDFFAGTEQLLFLRRFESGPRYTLHNRIAKGDPDFENKRRVLESTIALRKIEREEDRRRQVRKQIYDDAGARDTWTRWHAIQEIEYLRKQLPAVITREDREDLTRLAARSEDETFKKALLKLLKEWPS